MYPFKPLYYNHFTHKTIKHQLHGPALAKDLTWRASVGIMWRKRNGSFSSADMETRWEPPCDTRKRVDKINLWLIFERWEPAHEQSIVRLGQPTIFFFCLDPSLHTNTTAVLNTAKAPRQTRISYHCDSRASVTSLLSELATYQMPLAAAPSSISPRTQEGWARSRWCGAAGRPSTGRQPGREKSMSQ